MTKEDLEKEINKFSSQREIAAKFGKSQSSIKYWLKKYNLKTKNKSDREYKLCPRCEETKNKSEFYNRRNGNGNSSYCKKCSNDQVTERQIKYKLECINYKGGECVECGYKKSYTALEFHHTDPSKKDFNIALYHCHTFGNKIKEELDKCILVCANCHREIHAGIRILN